MGVVSAFASSVRLCRRQTVVPAVAVAIAAAYGLVQFLQFVSPAGQAVASLLGYLGVPFLLGGFYGVVREAFDGRADPAAFLASGRANYAQLLVAYLVAVVVVVLVAVPVVLVGGFVLTVAIVALSVSTGGLFQPSPLVLVVAAVGSVLLLLPVLAVGALVQFFDVAVVLDDERGVDALRRSYRLSRTRTGNVVAYGLVRFAVGSVGSLPLYYYLFSRLYAADLTDPGYTGATASVGSLGGVAPYVALGVVLSAVGLALTFPAHVAYYRDLRAAAGGSGRGEADGTTGPAAGVRADAGDEMAG